jgi:hypothetical protein
MSDEPETSLAVARSRLEALQLYPGALRSDVEVVHWAWLFRLPWMRRYGAYALIRRIALRHSPEELIARDGRDQFERLLVHELCHVWQFQHRPMATALALLRFRYRDNPFEQEARRAAQEA